MSTLRIIFAGSGEFGLPSLRAILDAGHDLVQVVTQPDRPAGRGKQLTPTPIGAFAAERALPLIKSANINAESLPPADLMVVIAFGQKIAEPLVNHPRLGSINLHASLLPRYRGAAPINWAILKGEVVTGNSVIRLAQTMDAGAILAQSRVEIGETETTGELHDRLAFDGGSLIRAVLDQLASGQATEMLQDESQATLAPKLSRDCTRIDWTRDATTIANQIRGLYPWPGCRVQLTGDSRTRLTLVRARPAEALDGAPGAILDERHIACGRGAIELIDVQPEGKRPMPLAAFRNGHPWKPGMVLESIT